MRNGRSNEINVQNDSKKNGDREKKYQVKIKYKFEKEKGFDDDNDDDGIKHLR